MTRIDKLMNTAKFDAELLSPREAERLRELLYFAIRERDCPGDFPSVFGAGRPVGGTDNCPRVTGRANCAYCWLEEVE